MSGRRGVDPGWFSDVEEAQLRRLVFRGFALRGEPGYREAIEAIETWQADTCPERLQRHTRKEKS